LRRHLVMQVEKESGVRLNVEYVELRVTTGNLVVYEKTLMYNHKIIQQIPIMIKGMMKTLKIGTHPW